MPIIELIWSQSDLLDFGYDLIIRLRAMPQIPDWPLNEMVTLLIVQVLYNQLVQHLPKN
jgi:hypothetical protein